MDPQTSLFNNFFIKNGSHDTIHIFKNYFATVFSIFNFQFQQNKFYPNGLIVPSLLLFFVIRGSKASTSRRFLVRLQTKILGCSLHWFDFTLFKIKDRGWAGSVSSFSRQQVTALSSSKHLLLSKWKAASEAWKSELISEKAIAR